MALFQKSVITKFYNSLDQNAVDKAWQTYSAHFFDPKIQENIRNSKEEQYQGEFLIDLFVNVLGYTKNPQPNFNITTELKNEKDSKKADGAIIFDNKVFAVIELKGTNTTDLNKIETQAFGYKNNQKDCTYVITSNFEKLRFYIDNTIEHLEFKLFTLTREEFNLLYCCLHVENIRHNKPKHLKDESVSKETNITKKLYKDYSEFKRVLFDNLTERNPQYDKLLLFKKTQKLLDRFLFIFFAEDSHLVPTNLIRRINFEWENLQKMRIPVSLYDRYKMYFSDLNTGSKVTLPAFGTKTGDAVTAEFEIFAYNGGLFAPDEILDDLEIDDQLLHKHSIILSDYDFASEVDVNILGHIFENSLNEMDEIKAILEGGAVEKSQTKRKKDGVFYTPKYITKYIVDNTVGKLCEEKKNEIGIGDFDFDSIQATKSQKKKHLEKITAYRQWLLQLTICDPACGSGAFLNQALDFLIAEHRYLDELQANLFGDSLVLSDVETHILENNLYGVDLNEESVEIAKLSLWLRTAQRGRKLNSLNNNIKCGNSLIDDPEIAGDKAFDWKKEFETVFQKGGFDVVIGNPPYGAKLEIEIENSNETYLLFYKKGVDLLKNRGILSYIAPDSWLINKNAKFIRKLFLEKGSIISIRDVYKVFPDAPDVWCNIPVFKKGGNQKSVLISRDDPYNSSIFQFELSAKRLINYGENEWFVYINDELNSLFHKMNKYENLSNFCEAKRGFSPTPNDLNTTKKIQRRQLIGGEDFGRYSFKIKEKYLLDEYPKSKEAIEAVMNSDFIGIQRIRTNSLNLNSRWLICTYFDKKGLVPNDSIGFLINFKNANPFYLLSLLNSTLLNIFYKFQYTDKNVKPVYLSKLPIPVVSPEQQQPFIFLAEKMLSLNAELQALSGKFLALLGSELGVSEPSKALQNWYLLDFTAFSKELAKKKIVLSLAQKSEWLDFFETEKQKAVRIKTEIDKTDTEIDTMVYELYGLTEEEIRIVEG